MSGYGRENTFQAEAVSAANGVALIKLPNQATGALPGDETPVLNPVGANQRYRIRFLTVSFGGAAAPAVPAALVVTDGKFTFTFDVTGPLVLTNIDWQCAAGAEVDITLAAGGASLIGHINVSGVVE